MSYWYSISNWYWYNISLDDKWVSGSCLKAPTVITLSQCGHIVLKSLIQLEADPELLVYRMSVTKKTRVWHLDSGQSGQPLKVLLSITYEVWIHIESHLHSLSLIWVFQIFWNISYKYTFLGWWYICWIWKFISFKFKDK